MMYSVVLEPHLYALFAKIMGNRLGHTRYVPLEKIECAPPSFGARANISLEQFWQKHRDQAIAVRQVVGELALKYSDLLDTPVEIQNDGSRLPNLSRFPVFVNSPILRDRWLQNLANEGIGATTMYGRTLPEILAVNLQKDWPEYPNARRLARRLLTLPVHNRLRQDDICAIQKTFGSCVKDSSKNCLKSH